jgi:hypothetical protein
MADQQNKEELSINEIDDGSAIVELPENLQILNQESVEKQENTESNDQNLESNDDVDHPNDNEELRAAKRNRRRAKKDLIRKTNQEKDIQLEQLKRENEEIKRRLSLQEQNSRTDGIMRIDRGIDDAQTQIEYAKMKLAEAVSNNDGQGAVEAQTLLQNADNELRRLSAIRRQADQEIKRVVPQQQTNEVDPRVQRHASNWMSENSWYNPEARDTDSRVAKKVDELLSAQGWDPSDPDYWDELTSRLQKELPHRYNDNRENDNRNVRRPRNNVASSGREASASFGGSNRSQFVLSPDRVAAMKAAGAWENPERKAKMIKQFIAYDKQNRN